MPLGTEVSRNGSRWLGLIAGMVLAAGRGAAQIVPPKDSLPPGPPLAERGPSRPARATFACVVSRIVDGDTIECRTIGRVRLIGMDTPELDQQPFGGMAAQALGGLLPIDATIRLEPDVEARDRYGRLLAYLWSDSVMVNWLMVRQGWAVLLSYPPNVQYVEWFTTAQQRAREEGRGLWAIGGFDCRPVDRRRQRC